MSSLVTYLSAEGLPYDVVSDGVLFARPFRNGEIVLDLQPPMLNLSLFEPAVRGLTENLFKQDFGRTAASIFGPPAPRYVLGSKKVTLAELVDRWNSANDDFGRIVRDNVGVVGQLDDVVRLLEVHSPRGGEPWMFAQLHDPAEVVSGISPAGLVLRAEDAGRGRQKLHLNQSVSQGSVEDLRLGHRVTRHCQGESGATLYLFCYQTQHFGNGFGGFYGGTRFEAVLADDGPERALAALAQRRFGGEGGPSAALSRMDASWLVLGKVAGGGSFFPTVPCPWRHASMLPLIRGAPTIVPQAVRTGGASNNNNKRRRRLDESPMASSDGSVLVKYRRLVPV